MTTKEASLGDQIFAGKSAYSIEAFGTVTIEVLVNGVAATVQLENVTLAPGFMTNLVSLDILNSKGVHWNSEQPHVLRKGGKDFCSLHRSGKH